MTEIMVKEALRYMAMPYKECDDELLQKVRLTFELLERISVSRKTYKRIPIKVEDENVIFQNTSLSIGSKDLVTLFTYSKECYIMAVTLGKEVDREITIRQKLSMLDALVLDTCASVFIDKICDDLEQELMKELTEKEYFTMRFSPGYGDVPLEVQSHVLEILQTNKTIGLTLTKTDMLFPTKSITAFIGISDRKENRQKNCGLCNMIKTCTYRKRGERCGL